MPTIKAAYGSALCLVLLILLRLNDLPAVPIILGHPWLVNPTQRPICGVGCCHCPLWLVWSVWSPTFFPSVTYEVPSQCFLTVWIPERRSCQRDLKNDDGPVLRNFSKAFLPQASSVLLITCLPILFPYFEVLQDGAIKTWSIFTMSLEDVSGRSNSATWITYSTSSFCWLCWHWLTIIILSPWFSILPLHSSCFQVSCFDYPLCLAYMSYFVKVAIEQSKNTASCFTILLEYKSINSKIN